MCWRHFLPFAGSLRVTMYIKKIFYGGQCIVYSVQCTVHSVQYTVYSIQGESRFVQSIINFLAESPHQDGKACLEGQHIGPPFPASKHPQVEGDLEGECSRTCRMF